MSERTLHYQRAASRLSALSSLVPPCRSNVAVPAAWLGLHRPISAQFGQLLPGSWSHWAASSCPDCAVTAEWCRAPAGRGRAPQTCLQLAGEMGSSAVPGCVWRPSETRSTESPSSAEAGSRVLTGGRLVPQGVCWLHLQRAASVSGSEPFSGVGTRVRHHPHTPELCDHNSLVQGCCLSPQVTYPVTA